MTIKTKPEHEVAFQDIVALVSKHADKLSALELLAVAANMVGKLIAQQDQRHVSPDRAMRIVATNMSLGNQQAIDALLNNKAGSA